MTSSLPRVLMIDNNLYDLDLARIAVEEAGLALDLDTAGGGEEGQAKLTAMGSGNLQPYKAVLLDLNMPRMDGRQLLAWARAQPGLKDLVIIIFTSSHASRERSECLAMGASDYWVKPSDLSEYIARIGQLRTHL